MSPTSTTSVPCTAIRLPMGSDIPEWLIVCEPASPKARKGAFRFAVDVEIVEGPDHYLVMPLGFGNLPAVIDASGTFECKIYAPTKPVRVAVNQITYLPEEMAAWAQAMAGSAFPIPEVPALITDPHRSFWARLRYVFSGR